MVVLQARPDKKNQLLDGQGMLKWLYFTLLLAVTVSIYTWDDYLTPLNKGLLHWGCLLGLLLMHKLSIFARPPWRLLFALMALFLTSRYLFWRTFETLFFSGFLDFIGMCMLTAISR